MSETLEDAVLIDSLGPNVGEHFEDSGFKVTRYSNGELPDVMAEFDGVKFLGVRSQQVLSDYEFSRMSPDGAVGVFSTKINGLDVESGRHWDIPVFNSREVGNSGAVTELVIASLGMMARRLDWHDRQMQDGNWSKETAQGLDGETLLVVGAGRIGSLVARRAIYGYGMKVVAAEKYTPSPDFPDVTVFEDIDEALHTAPRAVSIHISSSETVMGAREFDIWMDALDREGIPGGLLVNSSRATAVEEDGLIRAAKAGKVDASVDVHHGPDPKTGGKFISALQDVPRIRIFPHIGGSTEQAAGHISSEIISKVSRYYLTGDTTGSLTHEAA